MARRRLLLVPASLVLVGLGVFARPGAGALAPQLSNKEFWSLIERLSEPGGTFRSDNLLSNELQFQRVIPELVRSAPAGEAYVGVGPEQNFTYIAALRPSIAFIVDIRRGNLDLHLLYKALFEISSDRPQFVSLLFSKPRPPGLDSRSTVAQLFDAYASVRPDEALFTETLGTVLNQLQTRHGFNLESDDLRTIEYLLRAFFLFGPRIQYSPIGLASATVQPTYAELMGASDDRGQPRGFLVSEDQFALVKSLESRNLIVPIVGNFAGPKAIRAVGDYLREKSAKVSVFYLSNVEEYLRVEGTWQDFCDNVSALPSDERSLYVRSVRTPTPANAANGLSSELGPLRQIGSCR